MSVERRRKLEAAGFRPARLDTPWPGFQSVKLPPWWIRWLLRWLP